MNDTPVTVARGKPISIPQALEAVDAWMKEVNEILAFVHAPPGYRNGVQAAYDRWRAAIGDASGKQH